MMRKAFFVLGFWNLISCSSFYNSEKIIDRENGIISILDDNLTNVDYCGTEKNFLIYINS